MQTREGLAVANKNSEWDKLVRWASSLGKKYNVDAPVILIQFRRLKNAGADVEQAKREIENVYAS